MPKQIVTEETLPVFLHVLDTWTGKLTWDLYRERMVVRLGERSISPMTVKGHRDISRAFRQAKDRIKNEVHSEVKSYGATAAVLKKQVQKLEAELQRSQEDVQKLQESFNNLVNNLYMIDGLDLQAVKQAISTPLRDMSNKGTIHGN